MAPGGYTQTALKYNPTAHVFGISLPEELGGHKVMIKHGDKDPRVKVEFFDLTMLATEFDVLQIQPRILTRTISLTYGRF